MDYDILILGGGIVGCAAAYELSKYSLNIALIEKEYDIAGDVSVLNAEIVYDGLETEDDIMAEIELKGNAAMPELARRFKVPYRKCNMLIPAFTLEEMKGLEIICKRAEKRGIGVSLLNKEEVLKLEPNIRGTVRKALYDKNTAAICPYELALAYGEVAFDNGVKFKLEEEVLEIKEANTGYNVITNKNKFTCKFVLDTTTNKEKRDEMAVVSSMVSLEVPETIIKTGNIAVKDINSYFKSNSDENKIIVDDSRIAKKYLRITGRQDALVTMTPSLGKIICYKIVDILKSKVRKDFNDKRREFYRFRDLSFEEKNNIIKINPKYGNIVCLCEKITEGEILDAIRRPLGARTVEGVKKRTGVTMGDCQGTYCLNKIVSILARETNKSMLDIVKDSKDSKILVSRIKEFENI